LAKAFGAVSRAGSLAKESGGLDGYVLASSMLDVWACDPKNELLRTRKEQDQRISNETFFFCINRNRGRFTAEEKASG
jgi:hypothetical protein